MKIGPVANVAVASRRGPIEGVCASAAGTSHNTASSGAACLEPVLLLMRKSCFAPGKSKSPNGAPRLEDAVSAVDHDAIAGVVG